MYTPKYAEANNQQEVVDFIRENGLAIVVSTVHGKLWATHTPLFLSNDSRTLSGHLAKANAQSKHLKDGDEVLAIFQGAHSYISSSWYDHENVPTWNYLAAHVYGKIKILEGDALRQELAHLVDKYEKQSKHPVSVEKMTPDYLTREMKGIVGFTITIEKIESAFKLSQNRDQKNFNTIIAELENQKDAGAKQIAQAMRKRKKE